MSGEDAGAGPSGHWDGDTRRGRLSTGVRLLEKAVFRAGEVNVGEARLWIRKVLDGHPRCDDAVLLLSEAMTNSVVHTNSPVIGVVVLMEEDGRVQIEVIDDGAATLPSACCHSPDDPDDPDDPDGLAESGRGIRLIRTLSSRWGFSEEDPRCVVWFVLDPW
ncbi:ATP-binding protein [Sphaerisporangium sp. NPDC088356]|uniref:ATP-binding protein n=1 Tax=Sphaerisporangium sp. NPDC088356 TaxID=3154871 RepID=UPI00344530DD